MRRATALILATAAITALGAASAFAATRSVTWNYTPPKTMSITKNTTVKWTWRNTGAHNVVIKRGSVTGSTVKSSGGVKASGTYSYKFASAGTFTVFCTPHINSGMRQTITVR